MKPTFEMRCVIGLLIAVIFAMATASVEAAIFSEDFEGGLSLDWTMSSTGNGRVQVTDENDSTVEAGAQHTPATIALPDPRFHLTMDASPVGIYSLNEAILTLDLAGLQDVTLSFWQKSVEDPAENTPLPSVPFDGSFNGDGVAISADGSTWHTLLNLGSDATYTQYVADISAAASSAGISVGNNFQIKFQQYDNWDFPFDGRAFDDIVVTGREDGQQPPVVPEPSAFVVWGLFAGLGLAVGVRRCSA